MRLILKVISILILILFVDLNAQASEKNSEPVFIGFDAEFGHPTSTSAESIRRGILTAIDEVNARGGVLNGRKLELIVKENRALPARGRDNVIEFAKQKDLVAFFCGKFSPVVLEEIQLIHDLKIPLLDPWAAADDIIDNGHQPNYAFRLSLRDAWAIPTMIAELDSRNIKDFVAMYPNTSWGRSNQNALKKIMEKRRDLKLVEEKWYNWGDKSFIDKYLPAIRKGAKAVILVANEAEGAILVKEVAALDLQLRVPIVSHWGVTGGAFVSLAGESLRNVDFTVVQTYSFFDLSGERQKKAAEVFATAQKLFSLKAYEDIESPVGFAHAYDLTHLLALAIEQAKSTDRDEIRKQLENIPSYRGLVQNYKKPFTKSLHEALNPKLLFMANFRRDGTIHRNLKRSTSSKK